MDESRRFPAACLLADAPLLHSKSEPRRLARRLATGLARRHCGVDASGPRLAADRFNVLADPSLIQIFALPVRVPLVYRRLHRFQRFLRVQ